MSDPKPTDPSSSTVPAWLQPADAAWSDQDIDGMVVQSRSLSDPDSAAAMTQMRVEPVLANGDPTYFLHFDAIGDTGASSPIAISLSQGLGLQVAGPPAMVSNVALAEQIDLANLNAPPLSTNQQELLLRAIGDNNARVKVFQLTNNDSAPSGADTLKIERDISAFTETKFVAVADTSAMSLVPHLQLANVDVLVLVGDAQAEVIQGSTTVIRAQSSGVREILASSNGGTVHGGAGTDHIIGAGSNDELLGGADDSGLWQFFVGANGDLLVLRDGHTIDVSTLNPQSAQLGFLNASVDTRVLLPLLYGAAFDRNGDIQGLSFWSKMGLDAHGLADAFVQFMDPRLDDAGFAALLAHNVYGAPADGEISHMLAARLAAAPADGGVTRGEALLQAATDGTMQQKLTGANGMLLAQDDIVVPRDWFVGSGDDVLEGGAGINTLAGGDGVDTAIYGGRLADYQLTYDSHGSLVVQKNGVSQDTLTGVEKLHFNDATLDLGVQAWAQPILQQQESMVLGVVGLYIGLFGRLPEAEGLRYWINRALGGETQESLAHSMEDAGRSLAHVGANPYALDDHGFVDSLFTNLLGYASAPAAADPLLVHVQDLLATGQSRADAVLWLEHTVGLDANGGTAEQQQLFMRTELGSEHALVYGLDYGSADANLTATQGLVQRAVTANDTVATLTGVNIDFSHLDWSLV